MAESGFQYLAARQSQIDHRVHAGNRFAGGQAVWLSEKERAVHTYVCGVSGSGKSRFLQNLLFQDIGKGHPVALIDPMGDLYRSVLEFVATGLERAAECGFTRRELLPRYLFLDASDEGNSLQLNPFESSPHESSEQQVDDLMKALERLFDGKLEEQRRLRNVLRATFILIAELNRLPLRQRPPLLGFIADTSYPLTLFSAPDILNMKNNERQLLLDALPSSPRLHFQRQYWQNLAQNPREQSQIVQSSWNVLQYLLADDLVLRVFGTQRSTFDFTTLLRDGISLFCFLPKNENLAGARFLGKYLTTKLQHTAYRRPQAEWQRAYALYLDEFHHFVDQTFADAMTNLRKFGLRVTNAHQTQSQPPFDTREGQSLLKTIRANSRVKVLFRLDRPDAEQLSKELFQLTQQRANFQATDQTQGSSEQQSSSLAHSSGQTTGSGTSSSQSSAHNTGSSSSMREDSGGDLLGGQGTSAGNSLSRNRGHSEHFGSSASEQRTLGQSKSTSESRTTRTIYHTLEGERELLINQLQHLPDRQCYVSTASLQAELVETPYVPDSHYAYVAENLPERILELQRERLAEGQREEFQKPEVRMLPAAQVVEIEVAAAPEVVEVAAIETVAEVEETVVELAVLEVQDEDDPFLD